MSESKRFEDLHKRFDERIKGKGQPVGIKLLEQKESLQEIGVMPLEENRALCQVLKMAAVYEKTRGISFENVDACVVGSYILGFGMPPEDIKQRWVDGYAYTPERFDALVEHIEALPQKKYEAAIIAPLKEFDRIKQEPDAIVMFINSAQSYLLTVSYFDATGKKPGSEINGHAACEVVSTVAMDKSPWLTIPCGGARSIADSQDDELWIGMKPDELDACLTRLEQVNFKYPAPVNQVIVSDMNPKHPLTDLIAREPAK